MSRSPFRWSLFALMLGLVGCQLGTPMPGTAPNVRDAGETPAPQSADTTAQTGSPTPSPTPTATPDQTVQAPTITALSPTNGGPGTSDGTNGTLVTVTGHGFGPVGDPVSVTVNGLTMPKVTHVSDTTLTFRVPSFGQTGAVVVEAHGQTTTDNPTFQVIAQMVLPGSDNFLGHRPGDTVTMPLAVLDTRGDTVTNPAVTWSSSDPSLAVSQEGVVSVTDFGGAVLTARSGSLTATTPFKVDFTYGPANDNVGEGVTTGVTGQAVRYFAQSFTLTERTVIRGLWGLVSYHDQPLSIDFRTMVAGKPNSEALASRTGTIPAVLLPSKIYKLDQAVTLDAGTYFAVVTLPSMAPDDFFELSYILQGYGTGTALQSTDGQTWNSLNSLMGNSAGTYGYGLGH